MCYDIIQGALKEHSTIIQVGSWTRKEMCKNGEL